MASTCNHYATKCPKTRTKILQPKNNEKEKNAPGKGQKGRNRVRFGCWRGWERLRTGENGWESLAIGQKDLSRLPARSGLDAAHWAAGPLGTRFWSGCGRAHQGARKGRCYLVPAASHKTGGAGLVLRGNFAVAAAVKLPQIQSGSPPGSAGCPQRTAVSFPPGPRPASQKTPGWRR